MVWERASPKQWPYYFHRCIGSLSNGRADALAEPLFVLQRTAVLRARCSKQRHQFGHPPSAQAERVGGTVIAMSALCQKQTFCAATKYVVIRSPRRRGRAAK